MNDKIAVSVKDVSKQFKLPHERQGSIKGIFLNLFRRKKTYEKQVVLEDVSFDIKEGEFFGIVGRNGSGKSTLLKLLAGIYSPDKGAITLNGKLTPFIELGVGFNPDLTGRENVYLNGALLGFNRRDMDELYDEIVAFSELEKFMDQKLKNYSSGMQVRLAFSIAIQVKNDILILDEVLAVGDEAFQQKCLSVFEKYKALKQTIILVTHDMAVVERFCNRAMMIKDGEIIKIGTPRSVAKLYSDANKSSYLDQELAKEAARPEGDIKITLMDADGKSKRRFTQNETMTVKLGWTREGVRNSGVAILKQSGEYIFGPNTISEKIDLDSKNSVYYKVDLNVAPGEYFIKSGLFGKNSNEVLEFVEEGPKFIVEASEKDSSWGGLTKLNHEWRLDDSK